LRPLQDRLVCRRAEAAADVSGFVENVIVEADGGPVPPVTARRNAATPDPVAADDFSDEPAAPIAQFHDDRRSDGGLADTQSDAPDREPVSMPDAPSLVPPMEHEQPPLRSRAELEPDAVESFAAHRTRIQTKAKTARHSSNWTALILVLFGFNVALIGARSEVVRFMPQTASLFAAIGLPVNLRQLTFENVKISKEENDGVSVLVVEGSIVSGASKAVEVPRLRFAVRNVSGQEIYSWTAPPSRSVLDPGETLPFRSRLASPPADASDVVVRFFPARDTVPRPK
jgi:hypothetical protein